MLEVLLGSGVRNIAVVVTRYFGGVLLGTGGLVRAYTQAVKEGLAACEIGVMRQGTGLLIEAEYNDIGKVLYLLGNRGVQPTSSEYAEKVRLKVTLAKEETEGFLKELTEGTAARVKTEKLGDVEFVQRESAT